MMRALARRDHLYINWSMVYPMKKKKKKQKQHTDKIETLLLTQSFFMELETYSPVQKLNKRDNPN